MKKSKLLNKESKAILYIFCDFK